MQKHYLQQILLIFLICSLPFLIYLASWQLLFYDVNLYSQLLTKNNASSNALNITQYWLDYFQDEQELSNIYGFSDLEKQHMQDVKKLVNNLELFFFVLLVIFISLFFFVQDKSSVFFYGGILTMIVPIVLYLIPFDVIFNSFHKLFFAGNWQFPSDSLLIQTFQANFFYDFAFRIFSLSFAGGFISALSVWKFKKHNPQHL